VAAVLVLALAGAGCSDGGGGDDIGAAPVNSAPTLSTPAQPATSGPGTTPTTAPSTTAAPTAIHATPTTTAATPATAAPTLTPELEAELIDVYTKARRVLYEAFLDPPNADLDAVARYWTPKTLPGLAALLSEWTTKQWRFEPGPGGRYDADVTSIEFTGTSQATLHSCVVTDAAIFDLATGQYIDPGLLSSFAHTAEVQQVDGRWLVAADEQGQEFRDVAGCDG
jgi:hypothetical protein